MDTPLRRPITTTSSIDDLIPTEKSTVTEAESRLLWGIIAAIVVSAVCSVATTFFILKTLDGQRWIGWTGQEVMMNGKMRRVLVPLFMKPDDLKDLKEGK